MQMKHLFALGVVLGLFAIGGLACPTGGDDHDHDEHEHDDGDTDFDDDDSAR